MEGSMMGLIQLDYSNQEQTMSFRALPQRSDCCD